MDEKIMIPAPLRQKMFATAAIGVFCFLVGLGVFLFLKDRTTLLLSSVLLVMCVAKAVSYHRILTRKAYEVVEGTCVAVAPKPLQKYRRVKILDGGGNEISLLLDKYAKIKIGYQYRFYFKEADRITLGNGYFDSALNADHFLGFEETGVFAEV